MTGTRRGLALLVCTAVVAATASTVRATQYTFTELGFGAAAINASGQIAGLTGVWTPNGLGGGAMVSLPAAPGGAATSIWAINASGQVIGGRAGNSGVAPACILWKVSGGSYAVTELPDISPLGSEVFYPAGLNDRGQVVGAAYDFSAGGRSYFWNPATPNGMTGTLLSMASGSSPESINASGEVTGFGPNAELLWKPSTPNGTIGTWYDINPGVSDSGTKINNAGQIAGTTYSVAANHGFLWTPSTPNGTSGSTVDLGDLPGGVDGSDAFDVNSTGVVVGRSYGANVDGRTYGQRAIIWTAGEGLQNLNDLVVGMPSGWTLNEAHGINDSGVIIGWGSYDPDGPGGVAESVFQSFVLTPTPEPASLALLGIGVIPLLARCRQRMGD